MGPGAACQLATRGGISLDRGRDLLKVEAEHVMKQEGGALQRRQTLQRHQQWQSNVVQLILARFHNWLRQPSADVSFALAPDRLEPIQAQARDDPAQKCCRLAHGVSVDIEPAQEGVLDHVLRVSDRAQHPISDADKARP